MCQFVIIILALISIVTPQTQIVYPRLVEQIRTRRSASSSSRDNDQVSHAIQLNIDSSDDSEQFALHLRKNENLVTRETLIEWHFPNGTKQLLPLNRLNQESK
jgi:hypothetical protein